MEDVKGIMPGMPVARKVAFAVRAEFSAPVSGSSARARIALPAALTGINAAGEVRAASAYNEPKFSRTMKSGITMKIELKYCST